MNHLDSISAILNVSIEQWVVVLRRDGNLQEVHRSLSTLQRLNAASYHVALQAYM
jgi:hypothetical protein